MKLTKALPLPIIATLTALASLPAVTHAQEGDEARYRALGSCIAHVAVVEGLDGKRQPDARTIRVLSVLTTEYMFEASALGYDNDEAHTYVVEQLAEKNLAASESGTTAVIEADAGACDGLVRTLVDG